VTTSELDNLAAETAAYMNIDHPDYAKLAARVSVSNLHKETNPSFAETIKQLYEWVDPETGHHAGFISDELWAVIQVRRVVGIDGHCNSEARRGGEGLTYLGVYKCRSTARSWTRRCGTSGTTTSTTLASRRSSAPTSSSSARRWEQNVNMDGGVMITFRLTDRISTGNQVVERPQYMLLRVALGIHGADLEAALETYELMSNKWFLHASPTLFHAGTRFPQMSSCFLLSMREDSIVGIYDTLKQCAVISKAAGGIGLSVHNIRSHGSYIKVINGLVD